MDRIEFLLLAPGVIYGVAVVDLIQVFQKRKIYWETILWAALLLEFFIIEWVSLYDKLDVFVSSNLNFGILILRSIIFAQMASIITPDSSNSKEYFHDTKRMLFTVMLVSIILNVITQYLVYDDHKFWSRLIGFPLVLSCLLVDKKWIRSGVAAIFIIIGLVFFFS